MIPIYLLDPSAIFLMIVWAVVWIFFFAIGQRTQRRLPLHRHLVRYSSAVFVCITLFYFVMFGGLWSLAEHVNSGLLNEFFSSGGVRLLGILLAIFGAGMLVLSRYQLRELTLEELFFSKSELLIHNGLYRYFKHPMYLGIFLALAGSLMLYPNILALIFMMLTLFFLKKKKNVEEETI